MMNFRNVTTINLRKVEMKLMKKYKENGVNTENKKVVLSLFFANYFLAKNYSRFSKTTIRKFKSENSHYVTRHKSSDYIIKVMTPTNTSSVRSNCRILLRELVIASTV